MQSKEIQEKVLALVQPSADKSNFIYELLVCYGISKTTITRLKKGDFNLSKKAGELLYKKKVFFKEEKTEALLSTIDSVSKEEGVLKHKPRFAILTDYETIVAKDLKLGKTLDIPFIDLPNYFDFFLPLAGSEVYNSSNDNEADRNAAYKMAALYDLLIEENPHTYSTKENIHKLNIFLSRLLFCFFAEDAGIFKVANVFTDMLAQHTSNDGSDTHKFLNQLFDRLNVEDTSSYPDFLQKFEYVNGGLFKDKIDSPVFTTKARKTLIELGDLNWEAINPDIFGSMIQAVVRTDIEGDNTKHYTSVLNILKLIKPLFLDDFYGAFEKATTVKQLQALILRIAKVKFFDPACGSGNFLIIAYKEIRVLEIEIIEKIVELSSAQQQIHFTQIQLSQFYGIELDDFAHEIAILSLWLAEHQMNRVFEERLVNYGQSEPILPLKDAGQIQQGNATRKDWNDICPIDETDEVYLIGNPPYAGSRKQKNFEKQDMTFVFRELKKYKDLDYISCWFFLGTKYIQHKNAKCAFVTTNSICQGQQVPLIWPGILSKGIEIDFAYQSFKWTNNAKGNAGITVVIVGLRNVSTKAKHLFNQGFKKAVKNINPYLMDSADIVIKGRSKPLSKLPAMKFGNMPNDGGGLILSESEKVNLVEQHPDSLSFIKTLIGSEEYIHGKKRYCFWIEDDELKDAERIPKVRESVEATKLHRLKSKDKGTNELAKRSHQFRDRNIAMDSQIIIPRVSSETRPYIPCGYLGNDSIISDSALAIYDAEPFVFSIINSRMHMVWVKAVGGKLETRYRYSKDICYNTFPFPAISKKQKENLTLYVFSILDERAKYPSKTLAQLYDLGKMPNDLKQAHKDLDDAIDQCYRLQPFASDTERLEYLFKLYEEMVSCEAEFSKHNK